MRSLALGVLQYPFTIVHQASDVVIHRTHSEAVLRNLSEIKVLANPRSLLDVIQ